MGPLERAALDFLASSEQGKDMRKRIADWMEKMSAGCLVASFIQGYWPGTVVGAIFLGGCLYLTWRMKNVPNA